MNALFFMDFVKCHNEGTRRIKDEMDAQNLPKPEFIQKEVAAGFDSVRLTLRNNIKLRKVWIDSEAERLLRPLLRDLAQYELRILNFVAEHGAINVSQAQRLFPGSRWHTVKKRLDKMVISGLLKRDHSETIERDPKAVYRLADGSPPREENAQERKNKS